MSPNEYQRAAMRTAPQKLSLAEAALGMATEASEAADVLKKYLFQGHPLDTEKLKKEMGDALWYMAYVCHIVKDIDLESVMIDNIEKLQTRFPNGFSPEMSMARMDEETQTIHFRRRRGGLNEYVPTECVFNSRAEMLEHIFLHVIPVYDSECTVIGIEPYDNKPDKRIGWKRTTIITAAVYDPYFNQIYRNSTVAYCDANVREAEWYFFKRNIKKIARIFPRMSPPKEGSKASASKGKEEDT